MTARLGPDAVPADPSTDPIDLRLVPSAVTIWLGVLAGLHAPLHLLAAAGVGAALSAVLAGTRVGRGARLAVAVALLCLLAGMAAGQARAWVTHTGPVAELAGEEASVLVAGTLTSDPRVRQADGTGGASPYVIARLRVEEVTGRGSEVRVRTPVLVVASDTEWAGLLPGQWVAARGRLAPADGGDVAALLRVSGPPEVSGAPGAVSRLTEPFRQGLRDAVADLPDVRRGLVPGMAIGDESRLPDGVRDAMRATGLTHLTAVSGVHVSIVLVAALGLARWLGARGYALPVLGVVTIICFALLVRPDPSVVRASTMGLIGVLGLTVAGRRRALPALAAAVVVLLLIDPWLARSIGFALSVLSTAGILVLAPVWRDTLRWLPRSVAEAFAVPLAAQVASIPVLVGFVAETSLASVPANILAAPAVAPATLLGVVTAAVAPVAPAAAGVFGWLAGWPAAWIALVAEHGARLPGAVLRWPGGVGSVVASVVLVLVLVATVPRLFRRPLVSTATVLVAAVVLAVAPSPGWPPHGWLVAACQVGQGDAFVLNAGEGRAVVVDAGPDPAAVDRCLSSLRVREVPVVVLTHFHADHVAGLPGVLDGRRVGTVLVSPLPEPAEQAEEVDEVLASAGVPYRPARLGEQWTVGAQVAFRVVWPARVIGSGEPAANDASVVLDAVVSGVAVLLNGDVEPPAQRALRRAEPGLRPQVMTVPHHGSRHQEPAYLTELSAGIALIGVGLDNRHGHPAPETLALLEEAGASVWRTDTDGTVAVVRTADGGLGVAARGVGVFAR